MFSTKKSQKNKKYSSIDLDEFQGQPKKMGDFHEEMAEKYLKKQGFKIIERQWRCRGGEVDLIALQKKTLHFVEVKARRDHQYGAPLESIDEIKIRRLTKAAFQYLFQHKQYENQPKVFSVVGIDYTKSPAVIEFIPNAFEVEGCDY